MTWPSYHCCALICCKPRHWSCPSNGSMKESYTQGISVHHKVCLPRHKCLSPRLKTACNRCYIASWRDWSCNRDVRESLANSTSIAILSDGRSFLIWSCLGHCSTHICCRDVAKRHSFASLGFHRCWMYLGLCDHLCRRQCRHPQAQWRSL